MKRRQEERKEVVKEGEERADLGDRAVGQVLQDIIYGIYKIGRGKGSRKRGLGHHRVSDLSHCTGPK